MNQKPAFSTTDLAEDSINQSASCEEEEVGSLQRLKTGSGYYEEDVKDLEETAINSLIN